MMWKSTTTQTKRVQPFGKEWKPSAGQRRGVEFLIENGTGALWADPGAGKTSMVLTAFAELKEAKLARTMLVIAPLRVCQLVWRQETAKWLHTQHLSVTLLHGPKKAERLKEKSDIYLINYEGLQWLADQFKGMPMPFDICVADELTKLKNYRSKRWKSMKRHWPRFRRRWGLTGTPAPNGYLDLFGQFLFLDEGAALGRFFTYYREQYFKPAFDGFNWEIREGAQEEIEERIKKMVCRISYDDLPEFVDDPREIEMDKKSAATYKQMKDDMLVELDGDIVTAANSAAAMTKLRQMANGAVYTADPAPGKKRPWTEIHSVKLEALEELVDELNGQPIIVAYTFHHDLERIRRHFKDRFGDIPHLGAGVSEKQATETQSAWNRGEIPMLLCHPASVGHGLNLQEGGAQHTCWFSADFDLELYDQFKRRIWRKGNEASHVFNHRLIVKGTIDELVFAALEDKDVTQARLLQSLATVLDIETPDAGEQADQTEGAADMAISKRLPRKDEAENETRVPKGWGKPATSQTDEDDGQETQSSTPKGWGKPATSGEGQRERMASKLEGEETEEQKEHEEGEGEEQSEARSMFSGSLRKAMSGAQDDGDGDEDESPFKDDEPEKPSKPRTVSKPRSSAPKTETPKRDTSDAQSTAAVKVHAESGMDNVSITFSGSPHYIRAAAKALFGF